MKCCGGGTLAKFRLGCASGVAWRKYLVGCLSVVEGVAPRPDAKHTLGRNQQHNYKESK